MASVRDRGAALWACADGSSARCCVTTVATLGVAALALLGPLENSLRNAALTTLKTEVKGRGRRRTFAGIRRLGYAPTDERP